MKRLEDLNAIDNFMFTELTMQKNEEDAKTFCRTILEPIINRKVRNIELIPQSIFQGIDPEHHGIQMDAFVKEYDSGEVDVRLQVASTIYDLEPNTYRDPSEERRTRYYHSLIDTAVFEAGNTYDKLPSVIVIMILPYDPFGLNRMMYTVKRSCVEEPNMPYNDGDTTIYLYTKGKKDIPSQSLQDMLSFLENSTLENAKNEELEHIKRMMDAIKANREKGVKYMHSMEQVFRARREGIAEGIEQGIEQGIERGEDLKLLRLVCKKLSKGMDVANIADMLEEDVDKITEIYNIAKKYAPEYDVQKIYEEYALL